MNQDSVIMVLLSKLMNLCVDTNQNTYTIQHKPKIYFYHVMHLLYFSKKVYVYCGKQLEANTDQ